MIRGLRESVRLTSRDALRMFHLADIWATRTNNEVRLVSGNDHVHSRRSAHYAGRAIDLHASDPDGLARMMRSLGYRVLWRVPGHYSHLHVETGDLPPTARADASPSTPRSRDSSARTRGVVRVRRVATPSE